MNGDPRSERPNAVGAVPDEVATALAALQDALRTSIFGIVPRDAGGARAIGRGLRMGRATAWRCWTIASSQDLATILAALPGRRGMKSILDALARAGDDLEGLDRIESSWNTLHETMRSHGFDATSLRSLASTVGESAFSETEAVRLRRSAFRGNASTYGIRTRLLVAAQLFVPRGPSLDLAAMILHDEVSPLRSLDPLLVHTGIGKDAGPMRETEGASLEGDPRTGPLLPRLCTPGCLERGIVKATDTPGEVLLIPDAIDEGGVRIAIGETMRDVGSPWAEEGADGTLDDEAYTTIPIGLPTESIAMILGIDRSLPEWRGFHLTAQDAGVFTRPIDETPRGKPLAIDGSIEAMEAVDLTEDHVESKTGVERLLVRGASSLGRRLEDFRFVRAIVKYPLLGSAVVLRWRRPPPTDSGRR